MTPGAANIIKLGGSLLEDAQRRHAVLAEIAKRWHGGEHLVIVHGGGKHIDAELAKLGIARRTHGGLRITDDQTLDVVARVLDTIVNPLIVMELIALGVNAIGLSGSSILIAEQHPPIDGVDLGNVGRVVSANPTPAVALLNDGALPVVSCLGGAPAPSPANVSPAHAAEGGGATLFNVNADSAAAAVAVALCAESLQFITDVPGVLDTNGEVVSTLHVTAVEQWISNVSGGMKPKLQAALHALQNGVSQIAIGENGGTNLVAA
jgi:acetylglutamate kinase